MVVEWKDANELYFAVKGQLIPAGWSQKDVDGMVDSYTKRLWGNCERLPRTSEKFEKVWKEMQSDQRLWVKCDADAMERLCDADIPTDWLTK